MDITDLDGHPAFLRLSDQEKELLMKYSELWEAPAGARLFYPGDSGEEILLVLEGRLETVVGSDSTKSWFTGDLWGEDRLDRPYPVETSLTAVEHSKWLRWTRSDLISLASATGIGRALSPLLNTKKELISGFSRRLPSSPGTRKHRKRIRPSMRPGFAGLVIAVICSGLLFLSSRVSEILPPETFLAAPAVFTGWILVFAVKRLTAEYGIETDAVTSRVFDWSRFAVESRHVPMDRVQGVETERHGLFRRILGIGTVIVKTSALDGELILRDINSPELLGREITALRKLDSERIIGRERESIRRNLETNGLGEKAPLMIRGPYETRRAESSNGIRFRKSLVVLIGSLLLPLLIFLIPIFGVNVISGFLPLSRELIMASSLLPLTWVLYRYEDWRNDSFLVSGGYAVDLYRKPLGLKESRRQVELASVQNIRTEQKGILPFLFRYGNVILVTAGGAADTVFENVSRPWKVQAELFGAREEDLRRREAGMRKEQNGDMIRFAEALDQIRNTG